MCCLDILHIISFILIKTVKVDKWYLCFVSEKIETQRDTDQVTEKSRCAGKNK